MVEQPSEEAAERSATPPDPESLGDPGGSGSPDGGPSDGPDRPQQADRVWSTPALVALAMTAVLLAGATAWHLIAVFLHVAPGNSVSQRYQQQVNDWIYPEFEQNWKLFAPNPLQQNITVDARLQTLGSDGRHRTGPWIGLTAQDLAAVRHNPAPSHVDQNLLRRAWDFYVETHSEQGDNTGGSRGDLAQEYLKRIAIQRLGPAGQHEQVIEVQVRSGTTGVAPPPWSTEKWSTDTTYRVAPWWPVNDQDFLGL
jgi:hypothetical protein